MEVQSQMLALIAEQHAMLLKAVGESTSKLSQRLDSLEEAPSRAPGITLSQRLDSLEGCFWGMEERGAGSGGGGAAGTDGCGAAVETSAAAPQTSAEEAPSRAEEAPSEALSWALGARPVAVAEADATAASDCVGGSGGERGGGGADGGDGGGRRSGSTAADGDSVWSDA